MSLTVLLEDPRRRERVVADCVRVIEEEVAARPGLSGMAIRAGYKAFSRIRPGITRGAVVRLIPEMAPVMDVHWAEASASGDRRGWYRTYDGRVADELLAVTDGLASRSQNVVLAKLYRSLRGSAREHVVAGVPRLYSLLEAHLA